MPAASLRRSADHICTSAGGSITAGTTYEFEWSYDGPTLRVFEGIPGGTTTLAGSVAATGTIVQKPSEVFALGDGGSGMIMTGENLQTNAHWIGQLDSIRLSTVARQHGDLHGADGEVHERWQHRVALNNENQKDIFVQASYVKGLGAVGSRRRRCGCRFTPTRWQAEIRMEGFTIFDVGRQL